MRIKIILDEDTMAVDCEDRLDRPEMGFSDGLIVRLGCVVEPSAGRSEAGTNTQCYLDAVFRTRA